MKKSQMKRCLWNPVRILSILLVITLLSTAVMVVRAEDSNKLTAEQLDKIDGARDLLITQLKEIYPASSNEAIIQQDPDNPDKITIQFFSKDNKTATINLESLRSPELACDEPAAYVESYLSALKLHAEIQAGHVRNDSVPDSFASIRTTTENKIAEMPYSDDAKDALRNMIECAFAELAAEDPTEKFQEWINGEKFNEKNANELFIGNCKSLRTVLKMLSTLSEKTIIEEYNKALEYSRLLATDGENPFKLDPTSPDIFDQLDLADATLKDHVTTVLDALCAVNPTRNFWGWLSEGDINATTENSRFLLLFDTYKKGWENLIMGSDPEAYKKYARDALTALDCVDKLNAEDGGIPVLVETTKDNLVYRPYDQKALDELFACIDATFSQLNQTDPVKNFLYSLADDTGNTDANQTFNQNCLNFEKSLNTISVSAEYFDLLNRINTRVATLNLNNMPANDSADIAIFLEQLKSMNKQTESYLMLSTKDQNTSLHDLRVLDENILQQLFKLALQENPHPESTTVSDTPENSGETSSPAITYICLGLSILGIIMGIVATICAIVKKQNSQANLNQLATQEQVSALDAQHNNLQLQQQLLEQKLSDIQDNINAASRATAQLNGIEKKLAELEEKFANSPVEPAVVPDVEPVIISPEVPSANTVVAWLAFDYKEVNPANSSLYETSKEKASIVLYDDNTIDLTDFFKNSSNDHNGWMASGYYYLFTPKYNGVIYDGTRKAPSGFFTVTKTDKYAKVAPKAGQNRVYRLIEPGVISMSN